MESGLSGEKARVIGFDLDGVIVDHADLKVLLAAQFGYTVTREQTPSDVLRTIIPKEIRSELQERLYNDPAYSYRAPLMPGAREGLSFVAASGVPYVLISRRKKPQFAVELMKQLDLWPKYFSERNAFFVLEPSDKNDKARELGVTHYVDDEAKVLLALTDVSQKTLFDQFGVLDYPERVLSWKELLRFFGLSS